MNGGEEKNRYFVAVHVGAGYHSPSNDKPLRSAMNRACLAAASVLSSVTTSTIPSLLFSLPSNSNIIFCFSGLRTLLRRSRSRHSSLGGWSEHECRKRLQFDRKWRCGMWRQCHGWKIWSIWCCWCCARYLSVNSWIQFLFWEILDMMMKLLNYMLNFQSSFCVFIPLIIDQVCQML